MRNCIALFGTCGGFKWREPLLQCFREEDLIEDVEFFDPVVEDWTPVCAEIEADHLANDSVLCFAVTGEAYGTASLAEAALAVNQALRPDENRFVVVYVEQKLDRVLMGQEDRAKDSLRARRLLREHLRNLNLANVFVLGSMERMASVALCCFLSTKYLEQARSWQAAD